MMINMDIVTASPLGKGRLLRTLLVSALGCIYVVAVYTEIVACPDSRF